MQTDQTNWRRTSVIVIVLGALVVAPWLVTKADHDNWDLREVTRRMPWYDPTAGLAGEITTDAAAATACATVPTFDVVAVDDGVRLTFDGPMSLGETNGALADFGIPLQLGLRPEVPGPPRTSSSTFAGGDPALIDAVEAATTPTGLLLQPMRLPLRGGALGLLVACGTATPEDGTSRVPPHPLGPGGALACSDVPSMTPDEAVAWLTPRYEHVRLLRHRAHRFDEVDEVPEGAVLAWVDPTGTTARVGFMLPGDPAFEHGWRLPDLGGCG